MRQTHIQLTNKDREQLQNIIKKGQSTAREIRKAQILIGLDNNLPESNLIAVLNVSRTTIWRTRASYLKEGLDLSIKDKPRPGGPKQFDDEILAKITALTYSTPPPGRVRWTVRLLAETISTLLGISISRETIRRTLKKIPKTMAQDDVMYCLFNT